MADYHLHLFGIPELRTAAGETVYFRTRKHFGLLVYLALECRDRGVPRDRLIELFWPEAPYERARHSLSQALTAIRGILGPDALSRGGRHIQLTCDIASDLDRPGAVGDDGGIDSPTPLDGLDDAGGADFGHWLDRVRHRLVTAVRRAVSSELNELRDSGDHRRVQERAAWLYRVDPRNETAVQLLAEGALAGDDPEDAARLLEDFIASNQAEPDQFVAVTALLRRIRSGLYHSRPNQSSSRSVGADVFVGRTEELSALRTFWTTAGTGNNVAAIVEGPAGIGKSTLVKRFAAGIAAQGHLVLNIMCHHATREIPYAGLSGLAETLARDASLGATDPRWLAEAARIAPSLRTRFPGIPEPPPIPGDQTRLMIAQAFREMITVVADGSPTLLIIEDIHNLDHASRAIVHMVGDRFIASPLAIAATLRTQHGRVVGQATRLVRDLFDWDVSLQLGPLNPIESREMVKALTRDLADDPEYEELIRTILESTQGQPYYIAVLVADWLANGHDSFAAQMVHKGVIASPWQPSKTMQAAFARHYQGLTANTRSILQLIACAGRPLHLSELAALTGIRSADVHHAVINSIALGVLTSHGDCVSFTNEAHRAFFYHAATPPSRSLLHAKLAGHLIQTKMSEGPNSALEAAHHFLEAGMIDEATEHAVAGASSAIRQGAVFEAEGLLRRLLEQEPSCWTVPSLLLAECLCLQGQYEECLAILETIQDDSSGVSAHAHRARLFAECYVRRRPRDAGRALQAVTLAVDAAKQAGRPEDLVRCLLLTAELAAQAHNLETLKSVQGTAFEVAESGVVDACAGTAGVVQGLCLLARGHYSNAYGAFDTSVTTFRTIRSFADLATALNGRGSCAAAMGNLDLAIADFQEAFEIVVSIGDNVSASKLAGNQAVQLVNLGALILARDKLDISKRYDGMSRSNRYSVVNLCNQADYMLVTGDLQSAERILAEGQHLAASAASSTAAALVLHGFADIEIAKGEYDRAVAHILGAENLLQHGTGGWPAAHGFDSEHFARLTLFRKWHQGTLTTDDLDALNAPNTPLPLAVYVEISGFLEWLAERGEASFLWPAIPFRQLVTASGLFGTSLRLRRLGIAPKSAPPNQPTFS